VPLKQVDLTADLVPLEWFLPGLLLRGYLNFLASLPGQGKTTLLTALAWQASRPGGGEFLGEHVSPGATIYVDFDAPSDGRSVRFWLAKHQAAYPDGDMSKINVLEPDPDTYGMSEAEFATLANRARETGASLIIVDSFMAAFPNADPVKLTAVQGPLWYMRRLAAETGACVILIDHLPKPMSGEQAGSRGIMGSVAKPAQARAVHILTRVPPSEVQGRNVLRWDTQKMSFAALPEPFGVELVFDGEGMRAEPTELPESYGETKTERAVRAMQSFLETQRGTVVGRKELLEVAIKVANVRDRAAKDALKMLLERLGDAVAITKLPGQGQPLAYRLKPEGEVDGAPPETKAEPPKEPENTENPTLTASLHQMGFSPSGTAESLGHTPLHHKQTLHQTPDAPEDVKELYRRFKAGDLKGVSQKIPGGSVPDLEQSLRYYFAKKKLTDAEQHDLLGIAKAVVSERETAVLK